MGTEGAPAGWLDDYRGRGRGKNSKTGIIFVHGFTGSPASMRPWAQFFHNEGFTVSVLRLPGHGRNWQDLNHVKWQEWVKRLEEEIDFLSETCEKTFICALSMGGGLSLYCLARNQGKISGIVLVNPMIHIPGIKIRFGWIIARLKAGMPSVGDDIKKSGVTEWGYDVLPTRGVVELQKLLRRARAQLPKVKTPLLLFHSKDDHTLAISNTEIVMDEVGSVQKQRIEILDSYHVAILDNDAELIFENSLQFIKDEQHGF